MKKLAIFAALTAIVCSLVAVPAYAQSNPCDFYPDDDPNKSMICDKKTEDDGMDTIKMY